MAVMVPTTRAGAAGEQSRTPRTSQLRAHTPGNGLHMPSSAVKMPRDRIKTPESATSQLCGRGEDITSFL